MSRSRRCRRGSGNASAAETLNTYSHLWPDSDDKTREAVDAYLGPKLEMWIETTSCSNNSRCEVAGEHRQLHGRLGITFKQ